jgi:iron complex outermembrane receptor protein
MKSNPAFILATTIATFSATAAEPAPKAPKPSQLSETIITAKPYSLTAPTAEVLRGEIQRTPGGVNLITSESYQNGRATTVGDMLRGAVGVYSPARGSEGDEVKLSIRGSGLDRGYHLRGLKLLQDGVPLSLADGQGDFVSIDPMTLRATEVWRGSNALAYGSTTLGGAINMLSLTGYDAPRFQMRLEGGSYGFLRGQISSGGVSGAADYYASLSSMTADGFQDHSRASAVRFFSNFGYRMIENAETRFYFSYVRNDTELPGNLTKDEVRYTPRASDPDAVTFDQRRDVEWMRLANHTTVRLADDQQIDASLYWMYHDLDHPLFWNQFFLNGLGWIDFVSNTFGGELRYAKDSELFGQKNKLTLGFAPSATWTRNLRFQNVNGTKGSKTMDGLTTSTNFDFFAEGRQHLTDRLTLVLGSSLSFARRDYDDNFVGSPNGNQTRHQSYIGFSPKGGFIYEWENKNQVFANVSRSFEPPTGIEIAQLGGANGDTLTRDIAAQRATTVEVGTRGRQGRIQWEAVYYYSGITNELLTLNDASGNPLGTLNGSETYHQGVELGVGFELLRGVFLKDGTDKLTLKTTYNWNDFRFRNDPVYGNNHLAGIPEHVLQSELLYEHPGGFYVGASVDCALSRNYADYANTLYANRYATLGAKIGYRVNKGLSVFIEGRNLTGEHYASAVEPIADARTSFGTPRVFHAGESRAFYGGMEYKW